MADVETYTVTRYAGPKVAGRVVAQGATIDLTEPEARAELLAGAIVKGKKDDKDLDPLAGSKKLAAVQANAQSQDTPPEDPAKGKATKPADPPTPAKS